MASNPKPTAAHFVRQNAFVVDGVEPLSKPLERTYARVGAALLEPSAPPDEPSTPRGAPHSPTPPLPDQ